MPERRILVTAALPYANGHVHIGHLVEYIQTDIWVRFQKLRGHQCIYICADDTHGTAIMIRARQEGRREEDLIADMQEAHQRDFAGFDIAFDHYGSTNSPKNQELCAEIWRAMRQSGLVHERDVEQLFDPVEGTFLPDRFVRGTCPSCHAPDQPGDNCSQCGAHYTPAELIDPVSTLSGGKPEVRTASHLFIELEQLHPFLQEWTQSGDHLQPEVANYLKGHFLGDPNDPENPPKPLKDWDVSRPAPYFGFEIPDSPGNYWYVWFDAPVGYMASTQEWCEKHGQDFNEWWRNLQTEIYHFIGKDIIYFHTLFWPAMLKVADFNLPKRVQIHGFLTVDGEKMSKSKGTFVMASTYLNHLDPAYLRYYYASKLGPGLEDIDLNFEEFKEKIDSDLVGKVVNIASRCAKFIAGKNLAAEEVRNEFADGWSLFQTNAELSEVIGRLYEECDYNSAMRRIMLMADEANRFVEKWAPWKMESEENRVQLCTVALNLFRQIAIYLAPVLPRLAEQTAELLNDPIGPGDWEKAKTPLLGTPVNQFQHMMKRVDEKEMQAMIEESKDTQTDNSAVGASSEGGAWNDGPEALQQEPLAETCTFEDFMKVDMRVARVIDAEDVADSKKLLRLVLSLGGEERRTVFAGIKGVYHPEDLLGRLVICCANLKPRKMKFGTSEGMVLAAGAGDKEIFLLHPDEGAVPGQRVH